MNWPKVPRYDLHLPRVLRSKALEIVPRILIGFHVARQKEEWVAYLLNSEVSAIAFFTRFSNWPRRFTDSKFHGLNTKREKSVKSSSESTINLLHLSREYVGPHGSSTLEGYEIDDFSGEFGLLVRK